MDGNASINIFGTKRRSLKQDLPVHRSEVLLCVCRMHSWRLNPLEAGLSIAALSRSAQQICLAVSPALKGHWCAGRPRLFEAKQAIRRWR